MGLEFRGDLLTAFAVPAGILLLGGALVTLVVAPWRHGSTLPAVLLQIAGTVGTIGIGIGLLLLVLYPEHGA